jgi:hypothetical protein
MKKKVCPLELKVLEGLKSGGLTSDLRNHLTGCSVCQDLAAVYTWMDRFKENARQEEAARKNLPSAEAIWNRVQARKRPDKKLVRKALRPILYTQILFYGVMAAGLVFLAIWGSRKIGQTIDLEPLVQILPYVFIPATFIVISLLFCSLLLAFEKRKKTI